MPIEPLPDITVYQKEDTASMAEAIQLIADKLDRLIAAYNEQQEQVDWLFTTLADHKDAYKEHTHEFTNHGDAWPEKRTSRPVEPPTQEGTGE